MRSVIAAVLMMPGLALAQDWTRIADDAAIVAALAGRTVVYDDGSTQSFAASGATDYFAGRSSTGRWAARSGQYCSQWPPSDLWACYDLDLAGDRVRFTGSDGSQSNGAFAE